VSGFKIDGLNELQNLFEKIEKSAEELEQGKTVSFDVLFNQAFMKKYTEFSSFEEFLSAGNFNVESQEDFEAIPDDSMDAYVSKTTKFADWETMLETAVSEYTLSELGF